MSRATTPVWRFGGAIAAACAAIGAAAPAHAETIIGLTTTNALVTFNSNAPTQSGMAMNITGLVGADERILGIDMRPASGKVYGLGSSGNVYLLNAATGAATFVAALTADPADLVNPFAGLAGSSFGIDFNPTVDRLRITSNAGQNLRMNVDTGLVTTDTALNGATGSISASAYSNNFAGATSTVLYGIDGGTDMLYIQNLPNDGTQLTVGALGVNTSNVAGFDISGASGMAYAALTDGDTSKSGLYSINLATGAATWVGAFGYGGATAFAPPLLDVTVGAVPEPETYALMIAGLLGVGWVMRRRMAR